MLNDGLFPFVRNRFYCGKLLTSGDFTIEQKYLNNKRRFLNKMMFGYGVVSGFNTYAVDDTTLMIESGFALDSRGREIILEKSLIKKLATIEGFNDIKTNKLELFVEYNEEAINPLYSLAKSDSGKEYEYNRVNECVRFFVKDMQEIAQNDKIEEKFIETQILYEDDDFQLKIQVPKSVCKDYEINVVARLEKLSESDLEFSGEWVVHVPGFVNKNGENQLTFKMNKIKITQAENFELAQSIKFEGTTIADKTTFVIKSASANFISGSRKESLKENILLPVEIKKNSKPIALIKEQISNLPVEQLLTETAGSICIAEIALVKIDARTCVINKVTRPDVYSQIYVPIQQYAVNKMLKFYQPLLTTAAVKPTTSPAAQTESDNNLALVSTFNSVISNGEVEIPITQDIKAGKIIYSDEVMHGLGTGDVFVDIGIEYVLKAKDSGVNRRIVYGDCRVFKDSLSGAIAATQAVKVLCEKGTFIVGIRFEETANISGLKIKWFAFKTPSFIGEHENDQTKECSIYVKKDTVVVEPNETVCIDVGFNNMGATALKYDIVDKDGGTVDVNGVYKAPNKEGVYEIKISCTNEPEIYTHAYVIVAKKDV
ncbi:MAG: hypothetical protein LBJ83_03060 [Oscillospiraceae bacterium]|jgi:hypothetical protein|nr:hypothetical protein [Oscillospiraceae bacterium]